MNELKKISIPALLVILSGAFLLVSFMLYLHKGKSAKWVARKMRIGGLILSLTTILNACDPAQTAALIDNNPPWTCYLVGAPQEKQNVFYLKNTSDSIILLNRHNRYTIEGEIRKRTAETYSYAIYDFLDSIAQKDNIKAKDGSFDEKTEPFEIKVDNSLKGKYLIRFYPADKDSQPGWSDQYFNLKIE
ncbi:MAG TPA: hypothetical protein PKH79_07345 [Prolixibacteraceae bacterium]|nr:hypothetical protein [Prolixibacteraceae bacterium]HPS13036.1 hypothetical protein [Prolixibacteraceae bacterium]